MKSEGLEQALSGIFEQATPALRPESKARVLQNPQHLPVRSQRRRFLAMAIGAAALLAGLGFVPFPAGSANGAWARALAGAEQAMTVYMAGIGDGFRIDRWASSDGFYRYEKWQGDRLENLSLRDQSKHINYDAESKSAYGGFLPPFPKGKFSRPPMEGSRESLVRNLRFLDSALSDMKLAEFKQRSLWGGTVDVVEVTGIVKEGGAVIFGPSYQAGDKIKFRAEIAPTTNLLLSQEELIYKDGRWRSNFKVAFHWNEPIPEELHDFTPPAGTTLKIGGKWWQGRVEKVVATEDTQDWNITLHAIDINRKGEIVLTLSRVLLEESSLSARYNGGIPPKIIATDDRGTSYSQSDRYGCAHGYWITTLLPERADLMPSRIDFTIFPYPGGESEHQSLTFKNLPLPARQPVEDLLAQDSATIQY